MLLFLFLNRRVMGPDGRHRGGNEFGMPGSKPIAVG
jgi:hypothetical protein